MLLTAFALLERRFWEYVHNEWTFANLVPYTSVSSTIAGQEMQLSSLVALAVTILLCQDSASFTVRLCHWILPTSRCMLKTN